MTDAAREVRHSNPVNAGSLLLPLLAVLLGGCGGLAQGSLRKSVNLTIGAAPRTAVQAWGYPAPSGQPDEASYNSLSVTLRAARPFRFVFPDGFAASSLEIDAGLLTRHLAPVTNGAKGARVSVVTKLDGPGESTILFTVGRSGTAETLRLYTCRRKLPGVLQSADGAKRYDFPLRQRDIAELFGGPMRIGHDFVIMGYGCD